VRRLTEDHANAITKAILDSFRQDPEGVEDESYVAQDIADGVYNALVQLYRSQLMDVEDILSRIADYWDV
jgi:hypothetical protein